MTDKKPKVRLNALSGGRFFLIMCIAAGHFIERYLTGLPRWVNEAATNYYFCTSTFFILSGFTLTYIYFDERHGIRISRIRFWVLRLSTIYPLHIVFILLMTPVFFKWGRQVAADGGAIWAFGVVPATFVSQLFALDAWNPFFLSVNGPAWSVSALCFFYVVFPVFCHRIKNFSLPQLVRWAALLWTLYLVYPTVYTLLDLDKSANAVLFEGLLHHNPLLRLPEFLIGVLVGRIFIMHRENNTVAFYNRIPPALVVAVTVVAYLVLPLFVPYALLHNGLFLPFQLLLILSLAGGRDHLTRFLSTPLALKLGNTSLTIFISHYFIIGWWGRVDQLFRFLLSRLSVGWPGMSQFMDDLFKLKSQKSDPSFVSFLIGLAALVLVSLLIQRHFVNPVSQWLRREYDKNVADKKRMKLVRQF